MPTPWLGPQPANPDLSGNYIVEALKRAPLQWQPGQGLLGNALAHWRRAQDLASRWYEGPQAVAQYRAAMDPAEGKRQLIRNLMGEHTAPVPGLVDQIALALPTKLGKAAAKGCR